MADMTAADIAAVTNHGYGYGYGYNDGFGFGGNMTGFILGLLFGNGGFGGWGANRWGADGRVATVEDLNNSANFTRLENQVRANENTIQQGFTNLGNGICQLGYQLATDNGQIQKAMSECCCGINRNIDGVNYNVASQAAAINANINEKFAALEKNQLMQTISSQAAAIQDLQLDKKLCGIVRYPTYATYNAGYPFACFNNGCGCGCNG